MKEEPKFEVTEDAVEESIAQEIHTQLGFKTSVCVLILGTGTECVGVYSPINVDDKNPLNIAENKKLARGNALGKVRKAIKSVVEWQRAMYFSDKARKQAEEAAALKQAQEDKDYTSV
jgi:hypothetical protein